MANDGIFTGWTTPKASEKLNLAHKAESKGMSDTMVEKIIDQAATLEAEGK